MGYLTLVLKSFVAIWAIKWLLRTLRARRLQRDGGASAAADDDDGLLALMGLTGRDVARLVRGVAARVEGWSESVERANGDGSNGANATAATASPPPARVVSTYDVTESDGRIIVSIDVPGLSREDLSVTVLDDERAVVVKGEAGRRKVDVRAVLPIKCEMRALSVRLVRGVLTIEVPVVVETEGRRVEIAGSPPRVSPGREKAAVVADCDEMSDGWTKQM